MWSFEVFKNFKHFKSKASNDSDSHVNPTYLGQNERQEDTGQLSQQLLFCPKCAGFPFEAVHCNLMAEIITIEDRLFRDENLDTD